MAGKHDNKGQMLEEAAMEETSIKEPINTHSETTSKFNDAFKGTNNTEKNNRLRAKKNRELGDLEDNQILNARLRSASGNVYTSSVTVDSVSSTPNSPALDTVQEVDDLFDEENMCKDKCCESTSNTSKLIDMVSKLQESVDNISKKLTSQEIIASNNTHRIEDVKAACAKNTRDMDTLEGELVETQFQLKLVTNIVIRQDQQIEFLRKKITEIQQNGCQYSCVWYPRNCQRKYTTNIQRFCGARAGNSRVNSSKQGIPNWLWNKQASNCGTERCR